jgi:hypothetical protein
MPAAAAEAMTARPHRSVPVTYRQAMDALHDAYLTLLNIQQMRLEPNTREQLDLLLDRQAVLVVRDDARR